jgi:hypothetical protein
MSIPPTDPINPYSAPQIISAESAEPVDPSRRRLPGFCTTVFIVELVFCLLRLALVGYSLFIYLNAPDILPQFQLTAIFEIGTGSGIAVFGIGGMVLLLARSSLGVAFGYLDAVCTVASVIVGWWQLTIIWPVP